MIGSRVTLRATEDADYAAIDRAIPDYVQRVVHYTVLHEGKVIAIAGIVEVDGVWWFGNNYIPHTVPPFTVFHLSCIVVQMIAEMGLEVYANTIPQYEKYLRKLGFYHVGENEDGLVYRLVN